MPKPFTANEMRAIEELRKLAKRWPKSLTLFSWSGTLVVFHTSEINDKSLNANDIESESIQGIPNDGGDPG